MHLILLQNDQTMQLIIRSDDSKEWIDIQERKKSLTMISSCALGANAHKPLTNQYMDHCMGTCIQEVVPCRYNQLHWISFL